MGGVQGGHHQPEGKGLASQMSGNRDKGDCGRGFEQGLEDQSAAQ